MAKPRSIFLKAAPEKVGKTIRLDAALWKSVETLEARIRELQLPIIFDVNSIFEDALTEAIREGNREIDAMTDGGSPRGARVAAS